MNLHAWILICVSCLALAVAMIGYLFLDGFLGAANWLVRRRSLHLAQLPARVADYLSPLGGQGAASSDETVNDSKGSTGRSTFSIRYAFPLMSLAAGLLAAVVAWDWLLSPWLAALGYLGFRGMQAGRQQATGEAVGDDLERLLNSFRSIWSVQASLFGALEDAAGDLEPGAVQAAVRQAADRARTGMAVEESLTPLCGLPSRVARQVAYVLEQLPNSDEVTGRRVLDELEVRLRRARRLRERAGTVLVLTRLTLRALQVANGVAIVVALTLPLWADFFTASIGRRMTFIAATLMVAGGSAYFAGETQRLEASL